MPRYDAFRHLGYAVFRRSPAGDFYVRKGRLYRSTETPIKDQAREAVEALQAEAFHTRTRGIQQTVTFATAAHSYLAARPDLDDGDKERVGRVLEFFASARLIDIGQAACDRAAAALCGPKATPATRNRAVVTPLSAILVHASRRGWCARPMFERPAAGRSKTDWLTPADAVKLIEAAADHVKPLFVFLLGTGCRVGEAMGLDWRDVDLTAGTVIFRETKNGRDRIAMLPPKAVVALANLRGREGAVFRRPDGQPYEGERGQFRTAWEGAWRRSGLVGGHSPHSLRHTFATWHYAALRDPMRTMHAGGWRSLELVERYAHLAPTDMVASIALVWGVASPDLFPAAIRRADQGQKTAAA